MYKLQLKNISKIYKVHKTENFYALKNINLTFDKTGFVSIVGKSGSGKSTLLNLIAKLDVPSSGEILFNQMNINDKKLAKEFYINKIGILFQNYCLIEEQSAIYNVMLPALISGVRKRIAKKKAADLLKFVGISENRFNLNSAKLSGGEKQRVALARAIINEPEVLLCDEPTGALDSKSSECIAKLLKELSKTCLVIVVSHNLQLTNRYSDRIISLRNGKVIDDLVANKIQNNGHETHKKRKRSVFWQDKLSLSNYKRRIFRNIFSSLGFSIGLASLFLAFGFINGKNTTLQSEGQKQFDYGVGTLSIEDKISSGSLLTITKSIRPELSILYNEANLAENFELCLNYDAIFPPICDLNCRDIQIKDCFLSPIYSFNDDHVNNLMLTAGVMPSKENFSEVLINESCYRYIKSLTGKEPLNDIILINQSSQVSYVDFDDTIITDYFTFNKAVKVTGVISETNYLSSNKIYYSFIELDQIMEEMILENLSTYMNKEIYWKDRISEVDGTSQLSSYSYRLFPKSISKINNLENISFIENRLVYNSSSLLIKESLKNFINVAEFGLDVFLVITLIGVVLVLGIVSFSNYSDDHKTSAILSCLGVTNSQIGDIYIIETIISAVLGFLFSIPLSLIVQNIGNRIISNSIGISNLISIPFLNFFNIPLLLPFAALFGTLLISILCTLIPIHFSKKMKLKEELQSL